MPNRDSISPLFRAFAAGIVIVVGWSADEHRMLGHCYQIVRSYYRAYFDLAIYGNSTRLIYSWRRVAIF